MNMANELLNAAIKKDIAKIDELHFFDTFAFPAKKATSRTQKPNTAN